MNPETLEKMADMWQKADPDTRAGWIRGCGETLRNSGVMAMNEWEQIAPFMRRMLALRLVDGA